LRRIHGMTEEKSLVRKSRRSSRLSTIVSITLVLFLLGTLSVLLLHANKLSDYLKENIEISLVIQPDADSLTVNELYQRVKSTNYVKEVTLISKEQAAEELKKELGEDFVTFLGYNPLYPSINMRLRSDFADTQTIESFISSVKSNPAVKEVQYQASLVESLNRNVKTISWILVGFSILLTLVAVALINNTIRISLYAKRLLIKSMLLVGATKGFIRKPFLINSVVNGIIGAVAAIGLLTALFYFGEQKIPELSLIRDMQLMGIVAGLLVFLGIFLSLICTLFAVNKYLRYRTEDLY
jgi:cell division transport system permease protein